ncbi:MAG: phosphoribosylformylglycinamidine synthase subunit PurL [Candidatus Woesearchaeota archaeon]|nr:phosphoribosylformylglycinamidine synthase subunit PurL [Candidatus Woesearchaeota archaeon]
MGEVDTNLVNITELSDNELQDFLKQNGISLKLDEAKKITKLIGRNPTLTELHIFNIEWSEHCSYKSSKKILQKFLPTEGPTVIQGPAEDAGIIKFTDHNNEKYGIVMAHESHNHPSQVVPYEGAATGVGGIIRDVLCMGARIIATADPLRFGDPNGKNKQRTKYIANSVIDGIAGYGNPLGIPNIGGDVYFSDSFDDNCIVNVVSLGIIKEKEIIHSKAPKNAEDYDVVIVGKATDNSGFGGAAFASLILDEGEEEFNKGAVQVPDPFLKNILVRATEAVFKEARKKNITLGFKDMGAGGIMCASSELCESGGFGADLDIDKVHTSMKIPPYITACGETQERFTWISPKEFTPTILKIYNEDFELPNVAEGARASVIGKVTKSKDYILKHKNKTICNVPVETITKGILYDRPSKKAKKEFKEPNLKEPSNYNKAVLEILSHPNVASKAPAYKHYDTEVQGLAVIRPGEADAGVQAPLPGSKAGIALSTDCNPNYTKIDPYHGAINAVAEAMRNVAAVGAVPYGMTDCLNFGNPEKPEAFSEFLESVKGIADAAKNIYVKGTKDPVPFVSGNVSFYNESVTGKSIDPSPIIACLGVLEDYSKSITMKIKKPSSTIFMVGQRKDELGGSVYYLTNNEIGKNIPIIDFKNERAMIYSIIDSIENELLLSCHDISDGGLITSISEMILGGEADGKIGVKIDLNFSDLRPDKSLFSETSGFVFEVEDKNVEEVEKIFKKHDLEIIKIGNTIDHNKLTINKDGKNIINLKINELKQAWTTGFLNAIK